MDKALSRWMIAVAGLFLMAFTITSGPVVRAESPGTSIQENSAWSNLAKGFVAPFVIYEAVKAYSANAAQAAVRDTLGSFNNPETATVTIGSAAAGAYNGYSSVPSGASFGQAARSGAAGGAWGVVIATDIRFVYHLATDWRNR